MALELAVESRESQGKRNNRRLRRSGKIPGVLYGHGLDAVSVSVSSDALTSAIRHGSRLVSLSGSLNESAFIREIQWNTWGTHILHVDFTRVSEHEIVEVRVAVELRGEAPGVREGGVVVQHIHEVDLSCPASVIPEKLAVNINHLNLNDSIALSSLQLPAGAKLDAEDLDEIVVECVVPVEMPEEGEGEGVVGEPEVIGAKEKEGEGSEED